VQSLSVFSDSSDRGEAITFLHANGFPPATYDSFLGHIRDLGRIDTLEHRPLWQAKAPTFLDWKVYASDAIDTLRREGRGPVWLVGHSMGGAISVLIASKAPELVKGIVALDPVTINAPFLTFSKLAFRLWPNKPKMIKAPWDGTSLREHDAAFTFYRTKRALRHCRQELMDFVCRPPAQRGVRCVLGVGRLCLSLAPLLWRKQRS